MSYFGGKIKSLPRFGRSKPKEEPAVPSRQIGYPLPYAVAQGVSDNPNYWDHEARETLKKLVSKTALDENEADKAQGGEKKKPLSRFRGKVKKRKGKKAKATGRRGSQSSAQGSKPSPKHGDRNAQSGKPIDAFSCTPGALSPGRSDTSGETEKPTLELPSDVLFDMRFLELETHFASSLSRAASLQSDLLAECLNSKGSMRRISSITCQVPELEQGPTRPVSMANSMGELDSILVCYIEENVFEDFDAGSERDLDFSRDLRSVEEISDSSSPEPKTPEPESEPRGVHAAEVCMPVPEVSQGAQERPQNLQICTQKRVLSVKSRRSTYPQNTVKHYNAWRHEIRGLRSVLARDTRQTVMSLCGVFFPGSFLASARAGVLRLSFPPRETLVGQAALSLSEKMALTLVQPAPQEEFLQLQELEETYSLEQIDQIKVQSEPIDEQFGPIGQLKEQASEEQIEQFKEQASEEQIEQVEADEKETQDHNEVIEKTVEEVGPAESELEEPDQATSLLVPISMESAEANTTTKMDEPESPNVCTKMDRPWWEFDSDDERPASQEAGTENPANEEEENEENEESAKKEENAENAEKEEKEESAQNESGLQSIFRGPNSSQATTDLFSECFDQAQIEVGVEETSLYKLIFPEEKQSPYQFQSGGFMEELSSFVEKSALEESKVEAPDPEAAIDEDQVKPETKKVFEEDAGQKFIESCQQMFVNGASFWMQTELLLLQMEDAVAGPVKEKKKRIKFEEDIDQNCPQIRIQCDDDDDMDVDMEENDLSKWDLRARGAKKSSRIKGCMRKSPREYMGAKGGRHSKKVGFKIVANLMENVESMGRKLEVTCRGRDARATVLATLKEFELILLNVKHVEVDVNYESIILYIKKILSLRRRLGEILSLTCGLQTEYVLVAESVQDDRASPDFDRSYWMGRLRRCIQQIRESRRQLRKVKAEISDVLKTFTEKTTALLKQSRKILRIRDDLLSQYQRFILANRVSSDDLRSSLESLRTFKEFLALYSTICTDGFKRLLWDDVNVLDKSRMVFERMNSHFGQSIKRQQLTLRGLQRPHELSPDDHRSKYKFRREVSLLKKQRRMRRRKRCVS